MSEPKRIIFTTASPNDQGGVIPNECLDFSRYKLNPVVLCQHVWGAPPIGLMTDIKYDAAAKQWSGVPVFHRITKEAQDYADMYEGGWVKACSIGGEAEWRTNSAGQLEYDSNGNKICEKFILYEISIVTLPSNPDAVTQESYAAKIYTKSEIDQVHKSIVSLSSKYKIPVMSAKKTTPAQLKLKALQAALAAAKAEATPDAEAIAMLTASVEEAENVVAGENVRLGGNNSPADPSTSQLPGVIARIVDGQTTFMGKILDFLTGNKPVKTTNESAPAPKGEPDSKIVDPNTTQPTPTGLTAEQAAAKKTAEECHQAAENACKDMEAAKAKAEKDGASQEDKDDYAAKLAHAEKCVNEAAEAAAAYKSCMESDEPDAMGAKGKNTNAAAKPAPTPKKKTVEELQADVAAGKVKLAPKREPKIKVGLGRAVPFTKLNAKDNEEGARIINRALSSDYGDKNLTDYQVVLESLMADGKYAAIVEKTRVIANVSENQYNAMRRASQSPDHVGQDRRGMNLKEIHAQLASGSIDVLGRDNTMRQMTTLSSTDNALAAPALNTIEWLTLAIFTLFPTTDWKNDIPMFGAQMTSRNTGLIWANITADPTIYFGNQPVNPADYTYNDDAVSLTLIPSWLQPMRWTPLTMHQLRYDQMATGWAQAFAKWGAAFDDKLIFTLASIIPAGSIIYSIGQKGQGGPGAKFDLTGANDPNAFFYNPNLVSSLATPAYNDITRIEQIYAKQNFNLDMERARLVVDPTQDAFIAQDPDTKSLLTRFIRSNEADVLNIRHTAINERSRVAIWDPASNTVIDPSGVIPATALSAGVGLLPSQVGMGLGMLDVFMIQDPTSYGYRMSADMRQGIQSLHESKRGLSLYTYGAPVNP